MKRILTVLVALCLLLCCFAGCNKSEPETVTVSESFVTPTPEPTAEPTPEPTPEPTEEPVEEEEEPAEEADEPAEEEEAPAPQTTNTNTNTNTNSNSNSNSQPKADPTPEPTPEPTPDPKTVALGLIGQDVSALYAAVGQPLSSQYVGSCLNFMAEDGYLVYDSFSVFTLRYSDGTEIIQDVD